MSIWMEYDENNNIIHSRNLYFSSDYEYDEKGNLIHLKDSDGYEKWCVLNDKNKRVYRDSNGIEASYHYDGDGNLIYYEDSKGLQIWRDYNEKGQEIHRKYSQGYEIWYYYDENGNCIHSKSSEGDECWYEYDKDGNKIHMKTSDGCECWTEYEYYSDNEPNMKDIIKYEKEDKMISTVDWIDTVDTWVKKLLKTHGVEKLEDIPNDILEQEMDEAEGNISNCKIWGDEYGISCNEYYLELLEKATGIISQTFTIKIRNKKVTISDNYRKSVTDFSNLDKEENEMLLTAFQNFLGIK